jgi:hypothetical protein
VLDERPTPIATKPPLDERTAVPGTQAHAWAWLVLVGAAVVGLVNVIVIAFK